ncbi:thioredoxin-like negative regulator of GroEL [Kibdelosporangium banguiense]|uniref:Thioredoxin-like negative regulator of GroEL n=1 Tax=Kibdelosporangium banguiense TaxID=1365924 RepID=A0ABS4TR52_9PSEU|nr:hypothetical protein [Kibdelosporangium banguiense]MBP2326887.1 thioredoxin-like negative regulator of GroEL [Kibdelosporangium banguiense]
MDTGSSANTVTGNVAGSVVQAGVVHGDVNLRTGAPVRTRYRQQVSRIAPERLIGREQELAELASFCSTPATEGGYRWWRAEAWSGKSALMSWFVLNPPPGVRVVSFFITARLSGQSDRVAFIENTLEQLVALTGEDLPPYLTESTREAHMLGLLAEAAQACRARNEHFVLVVDGLDEDRGVTTGPDAHSIAALLPSKPPDGMRIIVAGRPDPPIPVDVADDHPLRRPGIVRLLEPSPQARAVRADMERELKKLLHGSVIEQDLLGLLTAGGGGLTAADLAELTGMSDYEVHDHLRTVTGRTFTRRASHFRPEAGREVYLLGHEDLQVTAHDVLGPARLAKYRDRLHAWADGYRERGWNEDTPEYLLRGYYRMLDAEGDLTRMTELAVDTGRQRRLLDLSGGDVAASGEIAGVMEQIADQQSPDMAALLRLALHRDILAHRNVNIPWELPGVWAALGSFNRAESLALSIPDSTSAVIAMCDVITEHGRQGRHAEGMALADRAEHRLRSMGYSGSLLYEYLSIAMAENGDFDNARRVFPGIEGRLWNVFRLMKLGFHLGRAVDVVTLTHSALTALSSEVRDSAVHHKDWRQVLRLCWGLIRTVAGMADERLLAQLHTGIQVLLEQMRWQDDSKRVVELWIAAGQGRLDQAAEALGTVRQPYAATYARIGLLAQLIVSRPDDARALLAEIWRLLEVLDEPDHDSLCAEVAQALSGVGWYDEAQAAIAAISDSGHLRVALFPLIDKLVAKGDTSRVQHALTSFSDTVPQGAVDLARLAMVYTVADPERARCLAIAAEAAMRADLPPYPAKSKPVLLVEAAIEAGRLDLAESMAESVGTWPYDEMADAALLAAYLRADETGLAMDKLVRIQERGARADALLMVATHFYMTGRGSQMDGLAECAGFTAAEGAGWIARAAIAAGELDQAASIIGGILDAPQSFQQAPWDALITKLVTTGRADQAERFLPTLPPDIRPEAELILATALVENEDISRAARLVDQSTPPQWLSVQHTSRLATIAAEEGDFDRAQDLLSSIRNTEHEPQPLLALTVALARAGHLDRAVVAGHWFMTRRAWWQEAAQKVVRTLLDCGGLEFVEDFVWSLDDDASAHGHAALICVLADRGDVADAESLATKFRFLHSQSDDDPFAFWSAADQTTPEEDAQGNALTGLAKGVARTGDWRRATTIAMSITRSISRGRALLRVAAELPAEDAQRVLARAVWLFGLWLPLKNVARVRPDAIAALVEELGVALRP